MDRMTPATANSNTERHIAQPIRKNWPQTDEVPHATPGSHAANATRLRAMLLIPHRPA
jgi:hypothetical protein